MIFENIPKKALIIVLMLSIISLIGDFYQLKVNHLVVQKAEQNLVHVAKNPNQNMEFQKALLVNARFKLKSAKYEQTIEMIMAWLHLFITAVAAVLIVKRRA